jgi:hypothetical protein
MRRRSFSPDEVDDAIHLYQPGWFLARGGEHLGVGPVTALNMQRERGVPTRDAYGCLRVETGAPR